MKIVMGDNATGKTEALIRWYADAPTLRVIVTPTSRQRRSVLDRICDLGLPGMTRADHERRVFSANDITSQLSTAWSRLAPDTEVGFDEWPAVMQSLLGRSLVIVAGADAEIEHLQVRVG